jgi:hypothetical protein
MLLARNRYEIVGRENGITRAELNAAWVDREV